MYIYIYKSTCLCVCMCTLCTYRTRVMCVCTANCTRRGIGRVSCVSCVYITYRRVRRHRRSGMHDDDDDDDEYMRRPLYLKLLYYHCEPTAQRNITRYITPLLCAVGIPAMIKDARLCRARDNNTRIPTVEGYRERLKYVWTFSTDRCGGT